MSLKEVVDFFTIYKTQSLGKGAFAEVFLAENNHTHELCAVKIQKIDLEDAKKELAILQRITTIDSEHLMGLLHYKVTSNKVYLFLEKMEGNLRQFLDERRRLPESEALFYFHQIILGLNDIHSNNMIHRDIKPGNIFLNGDTVKIGDFNISSQNAMTKSAVGTLPYMSPDMLRLHLNTQSMIATGIKSYDCAVDLWSAGVILYEMLFGRLPMRKKNLDPKRLAEQQLENIRDNTGDNLIFPSHNNVTTATKKLLKTMLDWKHCSMLNAGKILNSECFRRFKERTNTKIDLSKSIISPINTDNQLRKSSILSASVLIFQNSGEYTNGLETRLLLANVDRVIQNEKTKINFMLQTCNKIAQYLQSININYSNDPKYKSYINEVFLFSICTRIKLFFLIRNMEHSINDIKGVNNLIARNNHILKGVVTSKQWEDIRKGGSTFFSETTNEFIQSKISAENDIRAQQSEYKSLFNRFNQHKMEELLKILNDRDYDKFKKLYVKNAQKYMISTLNVIDDLKTKELRTAAQETINELHYLLRDEKTSRIDWARYKVKIQNLPKDEIFKLNSKIRSTQVSQVSYLPAILFILALLAMVFFILKQDQRRLRNTL